MTTAIDPMPAPTAPRQAPRAATWRLSPALRKLLLSVHVISGVGLLGLDIAMVGLGATAASTGQATIARAAYVSMNLLINPFFPVLALSALVSGVVLSLGTKWGLLTHYWIVSKLVLNVIVILSGINLVKRFLEQAVAATSGPGGEPGAAGLLLASASTTNLSLLIAATVISVYKPWGKTRRGRRLAPRRNQQGSS